MKFELQMFFILLFIGLIVKKLDWRGHFFLLLFISAWVIFNWKKS